MAAANAVLLRRPLRDGAALLGDSVAAFNKAGRVEVHGRSVGRVRARHRRSAGRVRVQHLSSAGRACLSIEQVPGEF